jgi:hypothetical protein
MPIAGLRQVLTVRNVLKLREEYEFSGSLPGGRRQRQRLRTAVTPLGLLSSMLLILDFMELLDGDVIL